MANDYTATIQTAYRRFRQTLEPGLEQVFQMSAPQVQNIGTITQQMTTGTTVFTAMSGAITPQDTVSYSAVVAPAYYDASLTATVEDVANNPDILVSHAETLGSAAKLTFVRAWWTAVWGLNGTTHPLSGETALNSGVATNICQDSIIWDPPNAAANPAIDNLAATPFSADAVRTALSAKDTWLDESGNETQGESEKPLLIVQTAQEMDAINVMQQTGYIYDGTGLQTGSYQEKMSGVIKAHVADSANANSWLLWWRTKRKLDTGAVAYDGPMAPWFREMPTLSIGMPTNEHVWVVKAYIAFGIIYRLIPERSVYLSKP